MVIEEAWKTMFNVDTNGSGRYWLVLRKGESFSFNMVLYKTKAGATRGAKAAFSKINKEFEKNFVS